MLYRAGDRVTAVGTVRYDQKDAEELVHVDFDGDSVKAIFPPKHLKLRTSAWRVGDRFVMKQAKERGMVLAVREYEDGSAVLFAEMENGSIAAVHGDGCDIVPPDPTPPAMPAGAIGSWVKGDEQPVDPQ